MQSLRMSCASAVKLAAIVLAGVLAVVETGSATTGPSVISTYSFTGTCIDCTGTGRGTLTLQNYTLGNALGLGNFVSFSYSSNLTSFTISSAIAFSGTLPTTLPSFAAVDIVGPSNEFISFTDGDWCATCTADMGTNGIWNGASAATAPALSTPALVALALLLALLGWILLKRVARRSSHLAA